MTRGLMLVGLAVGMRWAVRAALYVRRHMATPDEVAHGSSWWVNR